MNDYPGNPALAPEVREKILTTFRHTANLFQQGKKDDAVVGCEFILKMDARFAPAQQLLQAARGGNPIDVPALLASLDPAAGPVAGGDPLSRARAAMEARDFAGAIAAAQEALSKKPSDAAAGEIASQAQELLEAQPFVVQFVQKAKDALTRGDTGEAGRQADKAWSIDPGHPEIRAVRAAIAEAMAPGGGFEFQGDENAEIGISLGGDEVPAFTAPAADGFGFQFAPPEGEEADLPTIGLATAPEAEAPSDFGASAFTAPRESPLSFDAPAASAADAFSFEPAAPTSPAAFSFDAPEPAAPAAFSFDAPAPVAPAAAAPPPPPPPAAPAAFDFSAAATGFGSGDDTPSDPKVAQLLAEGDRAFDAGDHQGAIDIWSRIFLIDVTSSAASDRIDKAKKAKSGKDQRVEGIIAEGARLLQSGNVEEAKEKFAAALAIDPQNASARSYLAQADTGGAGVKAGESRILGPSTARPADAGSDILSEDILGDFQPPERSDETEGIYEGGESGGVYEEPEGAKAPRASAKKGIPLPLVLAGAGVLLLALGAGWFFFFRSSGGPATGGTNQVAGAKRITDATQLHKLGKLDEALSELSQVSANDPDYSKALKLIADYKREKAQANPTFAPPTLVDGRPAAEVAAELKAKGKAALEMQHYLEAILPLDQAHKLNPNDAEAESLLAQAREKVAALQTVVKQFNDGSYEAAIKLLWQMRQADPTNADVERLLINSYFNLAVGELQTGTSDNAAEKLKEILEIRPDDVDAQRLQKLCDRYKERQKDLMYRIFVKYLQPRTA